MDFVSAVSAIVGLTQSFFDIKDKLKNKEEKAMLSEWLISAGDLLAGVAGDIRGSVYPYAKCSQLNHILNNISHYTADLFDKVELEKVKLMVDEAYKVEQMFTDLNSMNQQNRDKNLNKIEESVGIFYSLGSFIKLG